MAKPPMDVSVVLTNFQKASKVIEALDGVSRFARDAGLGSFFPTAKSDGKAISEALEAMTSKLGAALVEIKETGSDVNKLNNVKSKREQFTEWRQRVKERLQELNSYDSADGTVEVVQARISVVAWCEGETAIGRNLGVLDELGALISTLDGWLGISTREKSDSYVDDWDDLVKSGTAQRNLGMAGETRFSAMLIWFQSICALLHTAVYVRNSALALYREKGRADAGAPARPQSRTASTDRTYVNSDSDLEALGQVSGCGDTGAVREATGTWKKFDSKFKAFLAKPMLEDEEYLHARNSHDDSGDRSGFWEDHRIAGHGVRALDGANTYLAGLSIGREGDGRFGFWVIDGTLVTINADGTHSVRRQCSSHRSDARHYLKHLKSPAPEAVIERLYPGYSKRLLAYQFGLQKIDAGGLILGAGEIDVPVADPGWATVATGFAVAEHHGAWVITLQYGQMRIEADGKIIIAPHPKMPWDGPFAAPSRLRDTFRLADDVDKLYRGEAETASLMPITNASFHRSDRTLNIRISCAPKLYELDVFQPTRLKAYSPPAITPRPSGTGSGAPAGSSGSPGPTAPAPTQRAT